jgi:transposase
MTFPSLGIDISKRKFDICLSRHGGKFRHRVFPNSPAGFSQLSAWLAKQKVERVHACMEATGTYGEALATYLHDAGHLVSVVNPAVIKAYGQSHLSRTKTDKADATLIAQFCAERHPPEWQPLPAEIGQLQALVRRLDALLEMRGMEANRLAVAGAGAVKESLTDHIAFLDDEITKTEKLIRTHLESHPGLREQRDLLLSIPGIGGTTAAKLLGEILDVKLYGSARQLAAFAGLAPRLHESGKFHQAQGETVKDGSTTLAQGALLPGPRRHQAQPADQGAERADERARQVSDGDHRGGDA